MSKIDYFNSVCICYAICSFVGIILIYIWHISELVIGSMYLNTIQSDFFINIALWLIINALLSIFLTSCICAYYYFDSKLFLRLHIYRSIMFMVFIYLGWVITGTILFLNGYNDIPKELKIYLYFVLVFGYVGVINIIKYFLISEQ